MTEEKIAGILAKQIIEITALKKQLELKDKVIADYQELLKDISENFDGVNDYCENWCNWLIYKKEHDRPIFISKEVFEKLKNSGCLYEPKIDFEEENEELKQQLTEKEKQIRHQVCNEIRKWAEENKIYCDENNYDACLTVSATNSTLFALKEFLSEIEKGEIKWK